MISPLITPTLMTPDVTGDWTGVIFTSETAVASAQRLRAVGAILPDRAYCVGGHTAQAATFAGFAPQSADGDAQTLVDMIIAARPAGPLLHLCGRDNRGDVAGRLNAAGIKTVAAIAYVQTEVPLSDDAVAALQQSARVIAPVFSPRSGEILLREIARIGPRQPPQIVAISAAAGACFAGGTVTIARRPDAAAMIDAITTLNPYPAAH